VSWPFVGNEPCCGNDESSSEEFKINAPGKREPEVDKEGEKAIFSGYQSTKFRQDPKGKAPIYETFPWTQCFRAIVEKAPGRKEGRSVDLNGNRSLSTKCGDQKCRHNTLRER
jgi:hypothetical protein